jgi:hypothetical protein
MPTFLPNIFGAYDTRDNLALTIQDFTESRAAADIQAFLTEFNRLVDGVTSTLSFTDTIAQADFGIVGGGEMQPYTEYGNTEGTRGFDKWSVQFPIFRYRDRQIYTEEFLQTETMDTLNTDVVNAAIRSATTRVKAVLRAVLFSGNYNFVDDQFPGQKLGTLTVRRLFNNDGASGTVYVNGQPVSIGTLQHYVTSGASSWSTAAFTTAKGKLRNVGRGRDTVFYVSDGDADDVRGLTGFVPIDNSRINDPNGITAIVDSPQAIGRMNVVGGEGEVIVMPFMPDGYMFANDRSDSKPVMIRERSEAQFRGHRLIQNETGADYGTKSLRNKRWEDILGAGVHNRANGVAVQISTSGTYTDPSALV